MQPLTNWLAAIIGTGATPEGIDQNPIYYGTTLFFIHFSSQP
jgi:hypothetical protein